MRTKSKERRGIVAKFSRSKKSERETRRRGWDGALKPCGKKMPTVRARMLKRYKDLSTKYKRSRARMRMRYEVVSAKYKRSGWVGSD